jgi:hypothetical protein
MKDYEEVFDNMMRGISLAFHFADFSNNFVKSNVNVSNKSFIQDNVPGEVIDTFRCLKVNFLDHVRKFYKNRKTIQVEFRIYSNNFLKGI